MFTYHIAPLALSVNYVKDHIKYDCLSSHVKNSTSARDQKCFFLFPLGYRETQRFLTNIHFWGSTNLLCIAGSKKKKKKETKKKKKRKWTHLEVSS